MTEKLKRCPFCGNEAVLEYESHSVGNTDDFRIFSVHCSNHSCIGHNMFTVYLSSTEARVAWNRRVKDAKSEANRQVSTNASEIRIEDVRR